MAARDPSGFENPKGLWHSDSFDASSEEEGGTQVRVYDGAGNDADAGFTVTRDVTAPGVSLAATAEGAGVALVWSASDGGSGLAGCELAYREGAGAWQPYSAACAGEGAFALAQPGTAYTFHLTTTDHVQNQGQAEESATTGRDVTKYYYFDGQRVAMRTPEDEVVWLHGDHLGSTSLATSEGPSPTVVARQLYEPFGAVRWASGTLGTDFGFTGQRADAFAGLVHMGARWYNVEVGRWVSADTIVPEAGNPQALNRYGYVFNRPLVYWDPSGHGPGTPVPSPVRTPEPGPTLTVTPTPRPGTPVPPLASFPYSWRRMSEAGLLAFHQYQGYRSNDCALTSIAMAANILTGGSVRKEDITRLADTYWLTHRTRFFPGQGVPPNQQVNIIDLMGQLEESAFSGQRSLSAYAAKGTTSDLLRLLRQDDTAVIVTIQKQRGDMTRAHAMVFAAYDPTSATPWGFLDPAWQTSDVLHWLSEAEFLEQWSNWGTQSIFGHVIDLAESNMVVVSLTEH